MRIGVISDTHNLLRREVLDALEGCDAILHAGDICREDILDTLSRKGPIWAVRGNNDFGWAERLAVSLTFELGGLRFAMAHRRRDLPAELERFDVAIYGHTHQYAAEWIGDASHRTLLLNPGSLPAVQPEPIEGDEESVVETEFATVIADSGSTVNIRTKAKSSAPLVERVPLGARVEVLGICGSWTKVKFGS